jgi:CIC family chloride channel protein
MALVLCIAAIGFVRAIRLSQQGFARLPVPGWLKPAIGGLALGALAVPILIELGPHLGGEGRGIGLLGGGYGAAQLAITGAPWLPGGFRGVELLALLALLKACATALTLGSGGSAGDFGPSLVVGGLIGGAFGRAAELLLEDPRIDAGAFALVGMGTFYGGLAHVPIASLVLVCELAGSYDLLVPLMLAEAIAFVVLRRHSLYTAQVRTKRDSPAHRGDLVFDVLREVKVKDAVVRDRPFVSFRREARAREILEQTKYAGAWQDVFPVLTVDGKLLGAISSGCVHDLALHPDLLDLTLAIDLMSAPCFVLEEDDLHTVLERMLAHGTREIVVLDELGNISGFLDESEIQTAYHQATTRSSATTTHGS